MIFPLIRRDCVICAAPLVLLGRMGYNKITVAAVLPLAGEGHFRIVRSEELGVRSYL